MDQERCPAINVGLQKPHALVSGVPGFDDDIVQLVAQKFLHHTFITGFNFKKVGEHARRREALAYRA